jgi:hypothetical protein
VEIPVDRRRLYSEVGDRLCRRDTHPVDDTGRLRVATLSNGRETAVAARAPDHRLERRPDPVGVRVGDDGGE